MNLNYQSLRKPVQYVVDGAARYWRMYNLRANKIVTLGAPDGPGIRYDDTFWDDYEFPINALRINPGTSKPDYDYTEVELLFDDASTETVVGNGHLPHNWKLKTHIYPHVHWIQRASGIVVWQLAFKIWDNNEQEPALFTEIETTEAIFAYTHPGNLGQISSFAPIDMINISGISPNIKIRLSRLGGDVADTLVGDAAMVKFDFHYEIDQPGSRQAYVK